MFIRIEFNKNIGQYWNLTLNNYKQSMKAGFLIASLITLGLLFGNFQEAHAFPSIEVEFECSIDLQDVQDGTLTWTYLILNTGDEVLDVNYRIQIDGEPTMNFMATLAPGESVSDTFQTFIPASSFVINGILSGVASSPTGDLPFSAKSGCGVLGRVSGGAARGGLVVDLPPTLGLDKNGRRIVDNGFSYNGNPVNVELFNTKYPLIKTEVGKLNELVLKIYDDRGINHIEFAGVAFGLGENQYFSDSNVRISLQRTFFGEEKIFVDDPDGVLDDVDVKTSEGKCGETMEAQCLVVTFYHKFKTPLDNMRIGTSVWDKNRAAWQNFFNHGVEIEGKSLNPPKEHMGINKGHLVHLYETSKNTAIDEQGDTWTFYKEWKRDYKPKGKIDDGITSLGIDRNNARFDAYKKGQELLAQHTLNKILAGQEIHNTLSEEVKTIYYSILSRSEDLDLQRKIIYEQSRAREQFANLFDFKINH